MNAVACCEGEEMTYCEEVCFFATEDKAEAEEPKPFWYDYEGFGGPQYVKEPHNQRVSEKARRDSGLAFWFIESM